MSLKKLFKRKPGGTVLGNLVRGAVRTATGGILGNGALMISKEQYDAKNRGENVSNEREKQYLMESTGAALNGINNKDKVNTIVDKIKQGGVKSIAYVVGGIIAIVGVIFLARKMFVKKPVQKYGR